MRSSHLLALTVVTAVLGVLVVQFSEPDPLAAEVVPSPPVVLAVAFPIQDEGVTAASEEALSSEPEEELTAQAEARSTSSTTSTTTTTLAPSTTVAEAAATAPSGSSGSSGSGSGSGSAPATTAPPQTTPTTQPPPPPPPSGSFNSGMESDFYRRINSLRASNGLPGLSANGSLASYARNWAKYMGENGKFGHSNVGSLVPPWSSVAENVGKGGSVGGIFGALAGSSAHLSNMLGNFTHVGVGVWVDASGTVWTAHVFAR